MIPAHRCIRSGPYLETLIGTILFGKADLKHARVVIQARHIVYNPLRNTGR
jgi:hypothetical protein